MMTPLMKVGDTWVDPADEDVSTPDEESTNKSEELEKQNQQVTAEGLPRVEPEPVDEDEKKDGEPEAEEWTFKTIARSLEELPIDAIQPFSLIPDYEDPTEADNPIIERTPEGNFCIEGWPLVKLAESEGKTSILCEIDQLEIHDVTEICLRKAGIRCLTRGGYASYPEMMRNTMVLVNHLLSADDDLYIYGHGQRRYKEGFINNQEDDIRHLLSIRMGKDRDTINLYLCHGEYLSDEAIKFFIARKAPKEFFTKAQTKKRIELKNQKGKNLSAGRITKAISKFMLEEFKKYLKEKETERTGKTKTIATPPPASTIVTTPPDNDDDDDPDIDPEEGTSKEPVTPERIFSTYSGVSKRMAEDLTKGISLPEMKDRLNAELKMIMKILNMIDSISATGK